MHAIVLSSSQTTKAATRRGKWIVNSDYLFKCDIFEQQHWLTVWKRPLGIYGCVMDATSTYVHGCGTGRHSSNTSRYFEVKYTDIDYVIARIGMNIKKMCCRLRTRRPLTLFKMFRWEPEGCYYTIDFVQWKHSSRPHFTEVAINGKFDDLLDFDWLSITVAMVVATEWQVAMDVNCL